MVPVVVAVLGLVLRMFVMPINADASYSCRSAAATLADPGREPGAPPGFFDDVTTCNRNARRRGVEAVGVAFVGGVAAIGLAVSRRYRRRNEPLSSRDRPGPTINR